MNIKNFKTKRKSAFTLVEILIVIAVIGIMSALVIAAFSGAAQDTRRVIARQQQASLQNAVNAWVNSASSEFGSGITETRITYNNAASSAARLSLVSRYLDDATVEHFGDSTSNADQISSQALGKTGQFLELTDWEDGSFPKVELRDAF